MEEGKDDNDSLVKFPIMVDLVTFSLVGDMKNVELK